MEEVIQEDDHRDEDQVACNRGDQMRQVKTEQGIIVRDAAAHPQQTNAHHGKGHYQESRGYDPEMQLAQLFVHAATGCFGEPVVDGKM